MENSEIIALILLGSLILLLIVGFYFADRSERNEKRQLSRKKLAKEIGNAFIENLITNYNDLQDYIFGFEDSYMHRIVGPSDIQIILNEAKYQLIKSDFTTEQKSKSLNKIGELKEEIDARIEEIKLKEPFKGVPSDERFLLLDILEISGLKSNNVFKDKLYRLGDLIKIREDLVNRIGRENSESLKLAKQSRFLAIVFFIISIGFAIYSIVK